jgi:hypothetical protein
MLVLGDRPIGGSVSVSELGTIEAGGTGSGAVTLKGNFPIGTVSGSLMVSARELAAPVIIPIEIRSHRPAWWVFVLFFVGAFMGLLWRTKLVATRDALTRKLAAGRLAEEIDSFLAEQPTAWVDDVTTLREKRRQIRPDKNDSITEAEKALHDAHAKREDRVTKLAAVVGDGTALTRTPWRLPMGVTLMNAASSYDFARSELVNGDLAKAVRWQDNAQASVKSVRDQCQDWCKRLTELLTTNDGIDARMPTTARAPIKAAVTHLMEILGDASAATDNSSTTFQKLNDAWCAATELVGLCRQAFAAFERSLPTALPPERLARLRTAIALPAGRPESPDVSIVDAIEASKRLVEAVRDIALELGRDPSQVDATIEGGNYMVVLTVPVEQAADQGRGKQAAAAVGSLVSVSDMAVMAAVAPLGDARPTAPVVPVEIRQERPSPRLLQMQIDRISRARWAIAAVVTSVAAWALYGDAFVGTRGECATLFGLGFVTDLTTDSAIEGILSRLKGVTGGQPLAAPQPSTKPA